MSSGHIGSIRSLDKPAAKKSILARHVLRKLAALVNRGISISPKSLLPSSGSHRGESIQVETWDGAEFLMGTSGNLACPTRRI